MNKGELYQYIGQKIREHRKRDPRKLRQEDLAQLLRVSRVSVANYESGNQAIYISDLYKIADFLEVDIASFLPPSTEQRSQQ